MKKLFILISFICIILTTGCTKQAWTRRLGADITINLPAGQELMMVTWKENSLFYLTRPMSEDYKPEVKVFQESSQWGVLQGSVSFIETR